MKKTITMKTDKLKEKILSKFGSINAFANHRKQDLNSWIIVRTLNGTRKKNFETVLKEIEQKVENLRPEKEIQNETEFHSTNNLQRIRFFCRIQSQVSAIFDDFSFECINRKKEDL